MNWPMIGGRLRILASVAGAVALVAGAVLAVVLDEVAWFVSGLVLVGIIVNVTLSKANHNVAVVAAEAQHTPAVVYEPGAPLDLLRRDVQRDTSALIALYDRVQPPGAMPAPGGWAATPETLLLLVDHIVKAPRIGTILECGSGTSTAWIAAALRQRGEGRLVSLEHDASYGEQTRLRLVELGLSDLVDVRVSALLPRKIGDVETLWFPDAVLAGIDDVTMLFVDGPPGYLGPKVRFPALPVLADRLVADAWVVLDDTDRSEEQDIVARWQASSWAGGSFRIHSQTDRATVLVRA